MPDTFTNLLRLRLQANGANDTVWGALANTVFKMTEDAIAGRAAITHSNAADYTLTTNNSATDEARNMVLNIGGALTGARNAVVPTSSKLYFANNATTGGFAVTVKPTAGTGISIPNGKSTVLINDGTNVVNAINYLAGLTIGDTLGVTGVATFTAAPVFSSGTASQTMELTAGKALTTVSITGTGSYVKNTSPTLVTPALGTPSAGVLTNCTGTAAGLTAGNVTTNANLTGPITSVGNATAVVAQTGTGSTFVMQASPMLTTPNIGTPSAGVLTNCTGYPGTSLTVIDAAGDLLYGTAADTVGRLPIGTADQVLKVNSGATAPAWGTSPVPQGYISGLELSNNAIDNVNDINIAAGVARSGDDAATLVLTSVLTKRIDGSWVVGTNQGGLDGTESVAGTPDNATWYYVWLIQRSDTGVVDLLFSESSSAPTLPANYDRKRLVGVVRRGTATNLQFYQDEGWFRWQGAIVVLNAGTATTDTAVTLTTAVPPIAQCFSASAQVDYVIPSNSNASNACVVQVASGVDFATPARHGYGTGASGPFVATASGGIIEVPNTGTFNYRNSQSLTNSRDSTIRVHGFKLAR